MNTFFTVGHLHLIVKLNGNRFLGERDARVQYLLRILRPLDGFVYIAQKYGTGSQHRNVHNAEHLYAFHTGVHTGTEAVAPLLRKYRSIGFGDACHTRHHVGSSPRGTAHILIRLVFTDSCRRTDSIHIFGSTADNSRFFNLAVNPLIHISERNHLNLMLCRYCYAAKHCGQQTQHSKSFTNHFSILLQSVKVHNSTASAQSPSCPEPVAPCGRHIYIYSSYNLSYRLHTARWQCGHPQNRVWTAHRRCAPSFP